MYKPMTGNQVIAKIKFKVEVKVGTKNKNLKMISLFTG